MHPYPEGLVIATKGGFLRGGPAFSDFGAVGNREYLRQCAYLTARRLGVEQLDLYYLHSPDAADVPFLDQVGTLAELAQDGVIRHIGLSNVSAGQFEAARKIADIAAVTALYNAWNRSGAALLAAAEAAGAVFSPWHPATAEPLAGPAARRAEAVLRRICERHEATVRQVGLAWLLHRSPRMLPIPGTSSPEHLREILKAAGLRLSAGEVDAITGLIPEPGPGQDPEFRRAQEARGAGNEGPGGGRASGGNQGWWTYRKLRSRAMSPARRTAQGDGGTN